MPRAKRQPLKVVKNGAQAKAESPAKLVVLAALKKAIGTMDHIRLRSLANDYCETMQPLREDFEKSLLVPGKKVVRYHADSDSEDDKYGEKESTSEDEIKDEDASYTREHPQRRKERKQIAVADDEMVPRYAAASVARLNSTSQLTIGVIANGIQVNNEDDFWADYDEPCHGYIDDLMDELDFQDGFKWSCCDELGDAEGCKWTKHKSDLDVIAPKPVLRPQAAPKSKTKRKAEEGVKGSKNKRRA
ncbi:hypothetical protein L207DRAFT_637519 [Hyaloscypha variabilis F]|uniref:Uncharacterized protein n=1 Tax=Hyaloscypha variabilis (strain UAMH 11265 / GT02V1 / F) TaxID=1149755 RepID=A0A2J6RD41_HYAVF|nr:hypothetical protein L207DRAFT_637519 [Hyaloscypha variabilis F]